MMRSKELYCLLDGIKLAIDSSCTVLSTQNVSQLSIKSSNNIVCRAQSKLAELLELGIEDIEYDGPFRDVDR